MNYRTRVMVALADFPHGSDYIRKGDNFVATEVDADYLHAHRKAEHASLPDLQPAAKAPPALPLPEAVEEPVALDAAAAPVEPAAPEVAVAAAEPRRRGRPAGLRRSGTSQSE